MAAEEPQQQQVLPYVEETVLKKRKSNPGWVLNKRERIAEQQKKAKERLKAAIKRPEQFVKEYRDKELDFIRMKKRLKFRKPSQIDLKSKLLFVIRVHGSQDMHPRTRRILNLLRLRNTLTGVFMKANEATLKHLIAVEPFITYGHPNLKSIRDLVYKKGCGKIERQKVPLTDNTLIEQALGQHNILCIEDIVHEIATVGPHFKEVTSFLWPFKLKMPERQLRMNKKLYKDGGHVGNREDHINELIDKLN